MAGTCTPLFRASLLVSVLCVGVEGGVEGTPFVSAAI